MICKVGRARVPPELVFKFHYYFNGNIVLYCPDLALSEHLPKYESLDKKRENAGDHHVIGMVLGVAV